MIPFDALEAAELALAAYVTPNGQEGVLVETRYGAWETSSISVGPVQALVCSRDGLRVIAFRGTELTDPGDLLADLSFWKVRNQNGPGSVSVGPSFVLEQAWPAIYYYCREVEKPNVEYHFVGHSLGGALATLAVGRLVYLYEVPKVITLWTFGSPRVGNRKFAQWLSSAVVVRRYVNYVDPITWVPRWWWGFAHVGEALYFNREGRLVEGPSRSQIWMNAIGELCRAGGLVSALIRRYHPMVTYKRLVGRAVESRRRRSK